MLHRITNHLFIVILIIGFGISFADAKTVDVTLPEFTVTLNETVIDNEHSEYPLIVYKDITYFPMTYRDCRFLGLESEWNNASQGLFIENTDVSGAYMAYFKADANADQYKAIIADFSIIVNGQTVDNKMQEYPLLLFRDITYFPMTWHFGVDEFNWTYSFDQKNGLVISSDNKKVTQFSLTQDRLKDRSSYNSDDYLLSDTVAVSEGNIYYVDASGMLCMAALDNLEQPVAMHQIERDTYTGDEFNIHCFYEENNQLMFYEHIGGASTGLDSIYQVKQSNMTQIQASYWDTTLIEGDLYTIFNGPFGGGGNLRRIRGIHLDKEGDALGDSNYWYSELTKAKGLAGLVKKDDTLYVKASKLIVAEQYEDQYQPQAVFAVDTLTHQMTKLSQVTDAVNSARIIDDVLYYATQNKAFMHDLNTHNEQLIGDITSMYDDSDSVIFMKNATFYLKQVDNGCILYDIKTNKAINPDGEVIDYNVTGDNGNYTAVRFHEAPSSQYRLMLFNQNGDCVFKTADSVSNITIEGTTLYYYNVTTETVCKVDL